MHALHFGPSDAPLFGLYHAAADPRAQRGVLLCYPGPEESMRVHWAYRNLTQLLLRAGLHVFRFDYYGTGDSAGPTGEGGTARWSADIELAAREFSALSSISALSLVGARLGASLVAQVEIHIPGLAIEQRVLWDPVIHGDAYLRELSQLQHRRIAGSRYPLERLLDPQVPEALGYPLRPSVVASIRSLDMLRQPLAAATHFSFVASAPGDHDRDLDQHLKQHAPSTYELVAEPCRWSQHEVLEQALLPTKVLQRISDLLVHPGGRAR